MTSLSLRDTNIGDEVARALADNPNIIRLDVRNNPRMGPAGRDALLAVSGRFQELRL